MNKTLNSFNLSSRQTKVTSLADQDDELCNFCTSVWSDQHPQSQLASRNPPTKFVHTFKNSRISFLSANPRQPTQVAASLDFRKNVKLVSDPNEQEPKHILNKMRKFHIDHRQFDPTLYQKTKVILQDLVQCSYQSQEDQQAINQLKNLKQFQEAQLIRLSPQQVTQNKIKGCSFYQDFTQNLGQLMSFEQKSRLQKDQRKLYSKQISRSQQNNKLPEYLVSFSPKLETCNPWKQLEALKNGTYDLNAEETNLNKLRQAISMGQNKLIEQIMPKLGLYALQRQDYKQQPKKTAGDNRYKLSFNKQTTLQLNFFKNMQNFNYDGEVKQARSQRDQICLFQDQIASFVDRNCETERYIQNTLETDETCEYDRTKSMASNVGRFVKCFNQGAECDQENFTDHVEETMQECLQQSWQIVQKCKPKPGQQKTIWQPNKIKNLYG